MSRYDLNVCDVCGAAERGVLPYGWMRLELVEIPPPPRKRAQVVDVCSDACLARLGADRMLVAQREGQPAPLVEALAR